MKNIKWILVALIAGVLATSAQAAEKWLTDFARAQAVATKENKLILMEFTGSDYCPPCKALKKQVFDSKDFGQYAKEKLVLVEVDFPERKKQSKELKAHNAALAEKYEVESFPTIIVVDARGKELVRSVNYSDETPKEYIANLEKQLNKK